MEDLISRQAVNEYLEKLLDGRFDDFMSAAIIGIKDNINAMPPVTPTRKSGLRWIERFDNEDKWLECPHCYKDSDNAYAYCPNCGASFKEEKRGSENEVN